MRAPLAGLFVLALSVPAAAAPIVVPFTLIDNQLYADVAVDGQGPFRFLLDTGAVDLVTPALAARLGLTPAAGVTMHGAGNASVQGGIVTVPSLVFGGAALTGENFYTLSLDTVASLTGTPVDGILGFEFFRRYVTRFDFAAHTLTLTDPAAFRPDDAGTAIAMTFKANTPEIEGSYGGIAGTFDIDTGDNGGLTLTAPFVAAHHLADRPGPHVDVVSGVSVGGNVYSRILRGDELVLGGVRVGRPVTELSSNTGGLFATGTFSGNIGIGVVKRFVMTLDYAHGALYFAPQPAPVDDLDAYDRMGMAIVPDPAGFKVYALTPGGPAEGAGIRQGDVITAVDGAPASGISIAAIHKRQRGDPPGTVVVFTLAGGKDIEVILRDQI